MTEMVVLALRLRAEVHVRSSTLTTPLLPSAGNDVKMTSTARPRDRNAVTTAVVIRPVLTQFLPDQGCVQLSPLLPRVQRHQCMHALTMTIVLAVLTNAATTDRVAHSAWLLVSYLFHMLYI